MDDIEIDAKFAIEIIKVTSEKNFSDDEHALFRFIINTTNYNGKTKAIKSSEKGKVLAFREQFGFNSTFFGINGKIESKAHLNLSLKEKSVCEIIIDMTLLFL